MIATLTTTTINYIVCFKYKQKLGLTTIKLGQNKISHTYKLIQTLLWPNIMHSTDVSNRNVKFLFTENLVLVVCVLKTTAKEELMEI